MRHSLRQGQLIAALLTVSISMQLMPFRLRSQEPAKAKPANGAVLQYFKKWEELQSKIAHFDARILIKQTSQPSREITWRNVSVKYLKADNRSGNHPYLEMRLCQWPEEMPCEYLVCHDFFYVFNYKKEVVQSYEIGALENYLKKLGPIKSLFGKCQDRLHESLPYVMLSVSPVTLLDRYDIKLAKEDEKSAQFDLLPVSKSDREIFEKGQLVLSKVHGLPQAIQWVEKDGSELSYELEQIDLVRNWKPGHFRKPASYPDCAGWNFEGPAESFPDESAKEDPDKVEAAPYFQKWEEAVEKLKRLECSVKITSEDKVFNEKETQTGTYRFLKVKEQTETKFYRHLDLDCNQPKLAKNIKVINDNYYNIRQQQKSISILKINDIIYPEKKDKKYTFSPSWPSLDIENSFVIVALTAKPNQILNRYFVKLAKEDDFYLYFDLHPKSKEDKSWFSRARLVLLKSTFLPRQIWCEQPNQTEGLYEFTNMNLNPDLRVSDFTALDMENFKGWSIQDRTRDR